MRRLAGNNGSFGICAVLIITAAFLWGSCPVMAQEVTQGQLEALNKGMEPIGQCPLKHTDVKVDIAGFIARVTLTQQFENPYQEPIEAVYRFPMSDRGAVDRMTMTIGERVIKGVIKEREEARRIYEEAKQAGQAASLLDQERPNIFTQSVANILPGEKIDITISYVEYLDYEDGTYTFSFPMVVGPRYIPGTPSGAGTDQVPDAQNITPPVTPEGTRAGHDIALSVALDAGVPVQALKSVLHQVAIDRPAPEKAVVTLQNQQEIPNRDFVLEYAVAQEKIADAILTHVDDRGGFVTMVLYPPKRVAPEEATPKEMCFVIDSSGSMRGFPIEKAKKTMRLCIEQMNPNDTFNLVSFAGGVGYCFDKPVPNTAENRARALQYLEGLEGGGGTEMMRAIQAALGGPRDPERVRIVCFMTDGFIGNDMAILDEIRKNAATARVFAFGIGNGVNQFLIEGMAREGRGEAEIVTLESDGDAAAQRFHERIHSPVLTDISVDFGGLDIEQVFPDAKLIPDLFAAKPLVLKGRYTKGGTGAITVRGKTAAGPFERQIQVELPAAAASETAQGAISRDVLAPLWARAKVDDLMAQDWSGVQAGSPREDLKKAIIALGLEFSLVTQYTSFVAVEEKVINEGGKVTRVEVPVEMTDGVSYEGVFGDQGAPAGMKMGGYGGGFGYAPAMAAPSPAPVRARRGSWGGGAADAAAPVMAEPAQEAASPPRRTEAETAPSAQPVSPSPKIDAALHGLAAKLVNGNYKSGDVEVQNGWVKVFIRVSDASEANLKALRDAGVDITSVTHADNTVLARVKVEALETVAKLNFVTRIEPPKF